MELSTLFLDINWTEYFLLVGGVMLIGVAVSVLEYCLRLKEQRDVVRFALQNLVNLKDHKDKNGKSLVYLEQQPKAWEQAKEALEFIDNDRHI